MTSPQFNITLVYAHRHMLADYERVAERIHAVANGNYVHLLPDSPQQPSIMRRLSELPSITFSPAVLRKFKPPRGPEFSGKKMPKSEQMRLLAKAGIRTPKWTVLAPGKTFDAAEWGEFVIVKPDAFGFATMGRGIELWRTSMV